MKEDTKEIHYLCVEANKTWKFIDGIRTQNKKNLVVIPNLSYGLVAVCPILPIFRKEKIEVSLSRVGSSESHSNPLIFREGLLPLNDKRLTQEQPDFVVVDGTRNIDGLSAANRKYPDSQQGYLNYAIVVNDVITDSQASMYADMLGVSTDHISAVRSMEEYQYEKKRLESLADTLRKFKPYAFDYWNPSGLKLSIYNHGEGCREKRESLSLSGTDLTTPRIIFLNTATPARNNSLYHFFMWGRHKPAYFDDNGSATSFRFDFNEFGVFMTSPIGKKACRIYKELYGDSGK